MNLRMMMKQKRRKEEKERKEISRVVIDCVVKGGGNSLQNFKFCPPSVNQK
jgi:hypothetical protein